jgi:tetratricopeptide (TPR) repeat protein
MAEPVEEADVGGPDLAAPGSDGLAAALIAALGRRGDGAKADPEFETFLRQQTRLSELQTEHLHEQRTVILARLKLGRWKDRVTLALQALTGLVGLAIAAAIAVMAWQAHEDHGLVIEAFSVPPDLAQRGLTGQVVAGRLLGRLADLQARTVTSRPASSYADDWGDDIKVEIPETGVSIGELNRYLRDWLGSETRISGDVVRTPTGIAVTAQVGASAGSTFEGSDADLPHLIQQAAEGVYAETQPYRYAVHLASESKTDQALHDFTRLAEDSAASPQDRAWAYVGWATLLRLRGDLPGAVVKASEAIALDPWIEPAYPIRESSDSSLGQPEQVVASVRAELRVLESGHAEGVTPEAARSQRAADEFIIDEDKGDYAKVLAAAERLPAHLKVEGGSLSYQGFLIPAFLNLHDVSGALRQLPADASAFGRSGVASALDDWRTALASIDASSGPAPTLQERALRAYLLARLGRIAEARAAIAATPLGCTACLSVRGMIAALSGDRRSADAWFSLYVHRLPESGAYTDWGAALLLLRDPYAAIVALKQAHKLGPHFADPLELWGEALMAKRDDAGAIPKFAAADKDAPKWGRNHLRWGEALMLSGRYAEARAQYRIANGLDLSVGDRAALNVLLARTAKGPLHG